MSCFTHPCRVGDVQPRRWARAFPAICVLLGLGACGTDPNFPPTWNPAAAATYLDQRLDWWLQWPAAARDHGTHCVSCHTVVPYALSRPSLRPYLTERDESESERKLLANVTARVRLWADTQPFYGAKAHNATKITQSRGTEAVLNALILAQRPTPAGDLTSQAESAFTIMWALQEKSGAEAGSWPWLDLKLAPWESAQARFYGACLAALAAGSAGTRYLALPEIQGNMDALRSYLRRQASAQPLHNKAFLLLAAAKLPGILDVRARREFMTAILERQNKDGGWSLNILDPLPHRAGTILEPRSDGYATGLVVYALREAGLPSGDARLLHGSNWLARHQSPEHGSWRGVSLNGRRDPYSGIGRFMDDAATGYAALALAGVAGPGAVPRIRDARSAVSDAAFH